MSFYITLPSNSNMDTHPQNRGGNYTVTMQNALFLDSTWEVGLSEAIYRRDWPNVRKDENFIVFEYASDAFLEEVSLHIKWKRFRENVWDSYVMKKPIRYNYKGKEGAIPSPASGSEPMLLVEYGAFLTPYLEKSVPNLKVNRLTLEGDISMMLPLGFQAQEGFKEVLNYTPAKIALSWASSPQWGAVEKGRLAAEAARKCEAFKAIAPRLHNKTFTFKRGDETHVACTMPSTDNNTDSVDVVMTNIAAQLKANIKEFDKVSYYKGRLSIQMDAVPGGKPIYFDENMNEFLKLDEILEWPSARNVITKVYEIPLATMWAPALTQEQKDSLKRYEPMKLLWKTVMRTEGLAYSWQDEARTWAFEETLNKDEPPTLKELVNKLETALQALYPTAKYYLHEGSGKMYLHLPIEAQVSFPEAYYKLGLMPEELQKTTAWEVSWRVDSWPVRRPPEHFSTTEASVEVPQGFYTTSDFLDILKVRFLELSKKVGANLRLDVIDGDRYANLVITPGLKHNWWKLSLSNSLMEQLGLSRLLFNGITRPSIPTHPDQIKDWQTLKSDTTAMEIRGTRPLDVSRGMDTLWVYTDIVEPQRVGNRQVPLLRIVPTHRGSFGETVVVSYEKPHYMGLTKTQISSIPIEIYNTFGLKPIDFSSDVILKLHFRQKPT